MISVIFVFQQQPSVLGPLITLLILFIAVFFIVMSIIKRFSSNPAPLGKQANVNEFEGAKKFGLTILGILIGGFLGFILRPSAPLVGQLPFVDVLGGGASYRGVDRLLVSTAQTSFNYMVAGAVIGAIGGMVAGYFLTRRVESPGTPEKGTAERHIPAENTQPQYSDDIAERMAKLAELRDKALISGEEYQAKKTELLNRL
jgi:hypothetical protein